MAESNVILSGPLKYRDGKKWKPRLGILKRLSPVADRLHLSLFKDTYDYERHHDEEKHKIPLENFLGIDSGFALDKERHVMAIVCQNAVIFIAFHSREILIGWELTVRNHLGQERQFPAKLLKTPPASGVPTGPCKLYIQGQLLCLTSSPVPNILATWHVGDLRRFGLIDGHFCFEAGSYSGKEGVYGLQCSHGSEIAQLLQQAAQGKNLKIKRTTQRKQGVSESSKGSLGSVSRGDIDTTDGLVYVDIALVEDKCDYENSFIGDTPSMRTNCTPDKQKLVSIDDARRERFCDLYNVLPRQVVKVQSYGEDDNTSLSQLSNRRYSCGDIDSRDGDARNSQSPARDTNTLHPPQHNLPMPHRSQRIRRPSYPKPASATTAEIHSRCDTSMSEVFTTVQNNDELSPKLRKCDGLTAPIVTENLGYERRSREFNNMAKSEELLGRGKENCEPMYLPRSSDTSPLTTKKYTVSSGEVEDSVNMQNPLHFIELKKFDGIVDDGYLYWSHADGQLQSKPQTADHTQSPLETNRICDRSTKVNPAYMNLAPFQCSSSKSELSKKGHKDHVKRSCSDQSRRANHQKTTLVSLHGSLKRTRSNASKSLLNARPPAPSDADPYGAYVLLKSDLPPARPRGRSLEDVLESDYVQSPRLPIRSSHLSNASVVSNCTRGSLADCPSLPRKTSWKGNETSEAYIHMAPTASTSTSAAAESSYLDMNLPRKSSHSTQETKTTRTTCKPPLQHSRSLDNELDSPHGETDEYLDMNSNGFGTSQQAKTVLRCVKSSSSLLSDSNEQTQKPFENLIPHTHHSSRRASISGKSEREGKPGSAGSSGSSSSAKSCSGRAPSLLSRIIRRNSHSKGSGKETPPDDQASSTTSSSRRSSVDLLMESPSQPSSGSLRSRSRHADMYVDRSALVTQLSQMDRASLDSLPSEPAPPPPLQPPPPPMTSNTIIPKPNSVPPPPYCANYNSIESEKPALLPRCKVQYINTDPDQDDLEWAMQQAPALPEKTYMGSITCKSESVSSSTHMSVRGGLASSRGEMLDDVFYENQENADRARKLSERIPQRRGQPNLTVNIPNPAGCQTAIPGAIPVIVADADEEELWPEGHSKQLLVSHPSQASLTSCTSTETCTTPVVVEDQKTSPALTTLRPRSGKEYQRLDRRKAAVEVEEPLPPYSQPPSALESRFNPTQSPTSFNAFSFDLGSNYSRKSVSSVWSSGEDSPKYPTSICSRQPSFREPIYMNLNFPRNESLTILEGTPPSSPGPRSISRLSEVQLNYAEIDLTETERNPSRRRRPRATPTEYAMIDMVATAAASRVGREHARLREDSLLRKESQRLAEGRPPPAHRGSNIEKKGSLSRHSSVTSRDR